MKRLLTILLLNVLMLQTFRRFVVEADYFLNKSYIAKILCVNKEKPKMHCEGKCYLAKQLKEQDKQNLPPLTKKGKVEVQLFPIPAPAQAILFSHPGIKVYAQDGLFIYPTFPQSVFHPPTV